MAIYLAYQFDLYEIKMSNFCPKHVHIYETTQEIICISKGQVP